MTHRFRRNVGGSATIVNTHLPVFTIATLPAGALGMVAIVSDGASNKALVVHNGTAWRYADGTALS